MDCLKAQELISTALDREPVDASELEQAKQHCRTCEECATFVAGLLALQKATPPHPSSEFTDNVMAKLRAEKISESPVHLVIDEPEAASDEAEPALGAVPEWPAAGTYRAPQPPTSAAPTPAAVTASGLYALAMDRIRDPRRRREVIAWAASAAVIVFAAGFAAMAGMRAILVPRSIPATESTVLAGANDARAGASEAPLTFGTGTSGSASTKSAQAIAPPNLVVLNGSVYRSVGSATDVTRSELTSKGSVRTSLAAAGSIGSHDALGSADPARIYIDSNGELLAFERVTRTFNGATYVLQSGPIDNFGQWPTWSSSVAKPVTDTGSPSFNSAGADAGGVTIFKPLGSGASAGIAVPPNAPAADPIAGDPDWTWWTPLR